MRSAQRHTYRNSEGTGTTTVLAAFQYNARGQVDLRTEGVASSVNPGYDAVGRLTSLAHAFATTSGNVTFGLPIYNPAGQIERFTRSNDSYAWTGGVEVDRAYSVNGLNQYTAAGTASFTYDANGNLTGDGSNTYIYDVENRLVAVSGARTANLRYDPLGRLYEIGAATPSRRLLWDGDALVAEYQTTTGTPLAARFVHGTAAGVDDPLVWYGGGENRRLHADHQGSVVAVTNGAGTATWINGYDEWGIPNATGNTGRFQYTGQIWIAELGMYHYKARIYSPTLGRFLQTDPVGYEGGINLYAYVGNDPVNSTDPSGLMRNCHPNDASCIETPESEELPGDPPPPSPEETEVQSIIVTGRRPQIDYTDDNEEFFIISGDTMTPRPMRWRNVQCPGGASLRVGSTSAIPAGANGAHSHGDGLEPHPGPRDDSAALHSRGGVAGMMTRNRSFTIRAFSNGTFRTRQTEGPPLSAADRANLIENMRNWEQRPDPGPSQSTAQRVCP